MLIVIWEKIAFRQGLNRVEAPTYGVQLCLTRRNIDRDTNRINKYIYIHNTYIYTYMHGKQISKEDNREINRAQT